MRLVLRAVFVIVMLVLAKPAFAAGTSNAPNYADVSTAIVELLNSPERMALPIERVRQALKAHYINNGGTIYWVGTGRMTPLIQRMEDAQFDGLNPEDYPIDSLIDVRDSIDANDPVGAAKAELYYSAFSAA